MLKTFMQTSLILILLFLSACSSNKYISQTATQDYRMDGNREEWSGKFQIPRGEYFAVSMSNDQSYLYLALSSIDKEFQQQLAMNGFKIWLDSKGGKRQDLGLQYMSPIQRDRQRGGHASRRKFQAMNKDERFQNLNLKSGDLELIVLDTRAGKRLGPADLIATATSEDESLFIEFQIPLALLGEEFQGSSKVGVGIESSFDKPNRSGGGSDAMGGSPMRGGGRSGGMAGGQGRGSRQSGGSPRLVETSNDLEIWFKVELAQ